MIESKFKEIAGLYNYHYDSETRSYFGRNMSKLPVTIHTLIVKYRSHEVRMIYELGNSNMAEVICELSSKNVLPEFKIYNKSHFWRLFNRKSNILKVESISSGFRNFLENQLFDLKLEQFGRDHLFEPEIKGLKVANDYIIKTRYYLGFPNKEDLINPIIEFHKGLIDYSFDGVGRLER